MTMGMPSVSTRVPKLIPIKDIFIGLLSLLPLGSDTTDDDYELENRPSPSLVSVPVRSTGAELIKKQLPVMLHNSFLEKTGAHVDNDDEDDSICVVCMNRMEPRHEVKGSCNCCHVFHRECLDGWIDQGHVTCPLCRSKMVPNEGEELRFVGDRWRLERMMYLFGEDYEIGVS